MDLDALFTLAAMLIRRYGSGVLDDGEQLAQVLVDKGTDAVATAAVGGLVGWLRSRGRHNELEEAARAAVASPEDEVTLSDLARIVASLAAGATDELAALVRVADQASRLEIESIRFGGVRAAVYVEGGGFAQIERVDVDMS